MVTNFIEIEEKIIDYWKKNKIYEKLKERNKTGKPFYYLDGPPYTSGKIHVGHAWGKTIRDMVMRYKRMNSYNVYDRAGFDMHGLPTQHKVQQKYNLKTKKDIEEFGLEKFTEECKKLALENMNNMIEEFERLGVWMDFKNPYMPITREYIEGIWWFIKRAYEKGRLYEGLRTLHWDPKDESALSKHELEYKKLKDESIFVKFKIKDKEKEYLLVWTTTPWTIPFNTGVMVNPKVEYSRVKVKEEKKEVKEEKNIIESKEEEYILIIATELVEKVLEKAKQKGKIKEYNIEETFKGEKLLGLKYEHPLKKYIPQTEEFEKNYKNVYTVVLSEEYVNTEDGSGLVHSAPGCGPEDYEVGYKYNLPIFNTVDEKGVIQNLDKLTGLKAKKDDPKFVELLEEENALFYKETIIHDYPHAERSKEPVIFRVTKQWFLKIEDLKPKMLEENEKVHWVPEWAGKNQFKNWILQLRDNSITKQIHWGTPLPIWKSKSGKTIVVESLEEIKKYSKTKIEDDFELHKPYIDRIILEKDGEEYYKIPDVLDVWVDAGAASWLSLDYPKNKELFQKFFPADFITEGKDQIRGWFNLLLIEGIIAFEKSPFKAVYMTGFVNDAQGRKMSKSLGNVISPNEVIEKYGSDVMRYYFVGSTNPGEDMNYNFEDLEIKRKNLNILFNIIELLKSHTELEGIKKLEEIKKEEYENLDLISKAMLSKNNSILKKITESYEKYNLDRIPWLIEELYLDLSRNYIQFVREILSQQNTKEKNLVLKIIADNIKKTILTLAPITPHLTEHLHKELKTILDFKEESIHLEKYPEYKEEYIQEELEETYNNMLQVRQAILSARDKAGRGIRWPLKEVYITSFDKKIEDIKIFEEALKTQLNVKKIIFTKEFEADKITIIPEKGMIGKTFKKESKKVIELLEKLNEEKEENKKEIKRILEELKEKGKAKIKDYIIENEMIKIEHSLPKNFVSSNFEKGTVYINLEEDEEIIKEGILRELTRIIQEKRKELELKQNDKIKVYFENKIKNTLDEEKLQQLKEKTNSEIIIKETIEEKEENKKENKERNKEEDKKEKQKIVAVKIRGEEYKIKIEKV